MAGSINLVPYRREAGELDEVSEELKAFMKKPPGLGQCARQYQSMKDLPYGKGNLYDAWKAELGNMVPGNALPGPKPSELYARILYTMKELVEAGKGRE